MTLFEILALLALGFVAGVMIGCIGIGGVIVVPALVYLGGVPIHLAIAAAMACYVLTGIIGTIAFAAKQAIRWDMTRWLWAGAMPGAVAGAWLANAAHPALLEWSIGVLTAVSGLNALLRAPDDTAAPGRTLTNPSLATIGAVTGFASAMTGTGGPLVLVPLLMWLTTPVLTAIGLAQAIQLPIAALATVTNIAAGTLDLALAAALAVGLSLGSHWGARIAHRLDRATLRKIVSVVLVIVGLAIMAKLGARHLA